MIHSVADFTCSIVLGQRKLLLANIFGFLFKKNLLAAAYLQEFSEANCIKNYCLFNLILCSTGMHRKCISTLWKRIKQEISSSFFSSLSTFKIFFFVRKEGPQKKHISLVQFTFSNIVLL